MPIQHDTTNVYGSEAFAIMREPQFDAICRRIGITRLEPGREIVFSGGIYVNDVLEFIELGRGPTVRTALESAKRNLE